jgi:antitoxin component YwqK of YwqJK toxin-antitoxin module
MKKSIVSLTLFLLVSISLFAQENINKFDSKGQRHGLWKGVYEETKRPRYEGTFEHGKETGTFKYFDDTKAGTVIATREFKKDRSCYTIFFDQKGNKVSEGKMIGKEHEGEWKYYHKESPVVMTIENYKNGKLNGVRKVFYKNKAINEEIGYVDGVKNGVYRKYTEKGVVLEDAVYKDGEFHGPATYKDADGNLVAKGEFVLGRKRGIWKFYENGKLVREQHMTDRRAEKKKSE